MTLQREFKGYRKNNKKNEILIDHRIAEKRFDIRNKYKSFLKYFLLQIYEAHPLPPVEYQWRKTISKIIHLRIRKFTMPIRYDLKKNVR